MNTVNILKLMEEGFSDKVINETFNVSRNELKIYRKMLKQLKK